MSHTKEQIQSETDRLHERLQKTGWSSHDCTIIAPMTLQINEEKKKQNAIILAHSYQTPDIMYGVADYVGDSYTLSKIAANHEAKKIIFCSVYFMGETAKILAPDKDVLVPTIAGCSLSESIVAEDVEALRKKHPEAGVVCYVNTSAAVKAASDVCCTSSNALKIIDALPQKEIIFIPDKLMGINLQKQTKKKLILWDGTCIVHEQFNEETVHAMRNMHPGAKILAHTECSAGVVDSVDMAGSTSDMLNFVKTTTAKKIMLITECGITDRVKTEFQNKEIIGTCSVCPYMKKIMLRDVLVALTHPRENQIVTIDKKIIEKAKKTLDLMLTIGT